jgi:serine/threonine protein kinase
LWSIGVMMYEMIYGKVPYYANNHIHLIKIIEKSGPLVLPEEPQISNDTQDLILALLRKDPFERISYTEFFKHPYMKRSSLATSNLSSVSSLLGTSTPRSITGPSGLSLVMSRKTSFSSSPLTNQPFTISMSSNPSNILLSSTSSSRFARIIQEEELIDLIPADLRKKYRYILSLADVALEQSGKFENDRQEFALYVITLEKLLELLDDTGNAHPLNENLQQLIVKKIQIIDRLIKRIDKEPPNGPINLNLDRLLFKHAHEIALEAGFKDLLGYNAWRVYIRAASLAEDVKQGQKLLDLLKDRI